MRLPSFRSPAWVLAETATMSIFSLLSMLVIGRVIGPEAAGTGMIAIAAFALLDILGATLFTDALVQRPGLTQRHVESALTVAALTGLGMAVLLALGAPALAAASGVEQVQVLCLALAPLLPLSAFAGAGSGPVLRESRFALLAARVLIGQPLALGVGLWMAAAGWGAWAMIGNQAVATLVAFLMLLAFGRLLRRPRIERAALAAFLRFAAEHKEVYRIIDEAEFVDPASYRQHYETIAARIADRLRAGGAAGEFRDGLGELEAWALMGMNVFVGLRYVVWGADLEQEAVAAGVNRLLAEGVGRR